MYLLGQIVSKGLSQMGRLIKIFVLLPDKPGTLQTLVNEITSLSINIVEVLHDRLSSYIDAGTVGVILSLETENKNKAYKLLENLKDKKINFRLM